MLDRTSPRAFSLPNLFLPERFRTEFGRRATGLAPAYISTGALDLFLDEDLDYARRLIDCGVQTELHVYPGAIHAFEMVPGTGLAEQAAMDLRRGLDRLLR